MHGNLPRILQLVSEGSGLVLRSRFTATALQTQKRETLCTATVITPKCGPVQTW